MIVIKNLSLPHRLHQISCELPKNQLIGVLGANGAGKSSLLKCLAGISSPSAGSIEINGHRLNQLSAEKRSHLMAYLAQDTPVRWDISVYDVIALGLPKPLPSKQEAAKVHEVAEYFSLQPFLKQSIQTLSGGERARVHLARCLIKGSPILLADEPIAALDPYYQIDIIEHLKALSAHTTCIVVLHHLSLAYRFCDRILLMKSGEVIANGATESVIITENLATAFQVSATINPVERTIYGIQKQSNQSLP